VSGLQAAGCIFRLYANNFLVKTLGQRFDNLDGDAKDGHFFQWLRDGLILAMNY
jgi:hypothetical protein